MPGAAAQAIAGRPDVIFHLAAIVSGEAETDFDKGYAVNFAGTRALLEAIRQVGRRYRPKLVFASSIAVFGAPFPDAIPDDFIHTPLTSYGDAEGDLRAACWPIIRGADFSTASASGCPPSWCGPASPTRRRRASSPRSSASRSPGRRRCCRSTESVRHWFASPRAAVGFLVHAAGLERERLGPHVNVTMPGVCCTVGERDRGAHAHRRAEGRRAHPPRARRPGGAHRRRLAAERSTRAAQRQLGFVAETSFDDIIRAHIEDELGGTFAV